VWFLTIESIALLAVATTLGLFAGWLVWGGKPAASSAQAGKSASSTPLISIDSPLHEASIDASTSAEPTVNKTNNLTNGVEPDDTWLKPEEIDPGANLSFGQEARTLHTETADDQSSFQLVGQRDHAAELERSESLRSLELVATNLRSEMEQLSFQLETREADVVRLKAKLRKAVEEIEKRTALAQAVRAELADYQQRLSQSLASSEVNPRSSEFAPAHEHDDFAPGGTRFTPDEIDELVQARTASLQIQTSQLERRTALIQSRAEEAEARVVALKAEAAQKHEEAEAALAKAEQEATDRILALEIDLASARQRTNLATQELMEFGSEISAIRDTNAKHLQSVHETMRDLQLRLDTTKAALSGRSLSPRKSSVNAIAPVSLHGSALMVLPGMSALVVDSLAELGVSTLEDVASWTQDDVDHIQSLLPEDPGVIERNGWVAAARRSLSEVSLQDLSTQDLSIQDLALQEDSLQDIPADQA
jgi:predicted flap endonuclease-1-like 5' DNA nuclease